METRRKSAARVVIPTQKRKQQSKDYDTSDTESVATQKSFDEDDSEFEVEKTNGKRLASMTSCRNNAKRPKTIERRPTRRPDPNISNRNALMARENRKRKKELMEQLEHENGNLQSDLKKLQKVVDRQEVMIRGLRNERNYLKSVLTNQSTIVALLKKLQPGDDEQQQPKQKQQTSRVLSYVPEEAGQLFKVASPNSVYSDSGMSSHNSPGHSDHHQELESVFDNDLMFSAAGDDQFDAFNSDWQSGSGGAADDFLNFDLGPSSAEIMVKVEDCGEARKGNSVRTEKIRSEHNYVYPDVIACESTKARTPKTEESDEENKPPGICLHIAGGKVSIEFCAKCNASPYCF